MTYLTCGIDCAKLRKKKGTLATPMSQNRKSINCTHFDACKNKETER